MTCGNPLPTVEIIISLVDRPHQPIILVERKHSPHGWALPRGFMNHGESLESAARREAMAQTGLNMHLLYLFHAYSRLDQDQSQHTIRAVFWAEATGEPLVQEDAQHLAPFFLWALPSPLCFDDAQILEDYRRFCLYGIRPPLI